MDALNLEEVTLQSGSKDPTRVCDTFRGMSESEAKEKCEAVADAETGKAELSTLEVDETSGREQVNIPIELAMLLFTTDLEKVTARHEAAKAINVCNARAVRLFDIYLLNAQTQGWADHEDAALSESVANATKYRDVSLEAVEEGKKEEKQMYQAKQIISGKLEMLKEHVAKYKADMGKVAELEALGAREVTPEQAK